MKHESPRFDWLLSFYDDLSTFFPDEGAEVRRDRRVAAEALRRADLSFFTQRLPALHQEGLVSLECGCELPKDLHLRWLLSIVRDHPEPRYAAMALRCHRQLAHAVYKLEDAEYDDATKAKAINRYVENEVFLHERQLARKINRYPNRATADLVSHAARILREAIPAVMQESQISRSSALRECMGMTPKHGPGAVATGERLEEKWRFSRQYASIHRRFPTYDWFVVRDSACLLDRIHWYRGLQRMPSPTSKLVTVPKDSRGPRLICEEPLEVQYLQQGYLRLMASWTKHGPMKGHVLLDDQTVHRNLALESSSSGAMATLDLQDASDLVSRSLVQDLFPHEIFEDLDALRSTHTRLPNGSVAHLEKMSPMGSAVCFPTMAMTLWSLCVAALEDYQCAHVKSDVEPYRDTYIYGDDIIVPACTVNWVVSALSSVGLRVNGRKSFSSCAFRESCGLDAFAGFDVTPTRVRHLPGRRTLSVSTYLALLSYVNDFREKGWVCVANALEQLTQSRVRWRLPRVLDPGMIPGVKVADIAEVNLPMRYSTSRSRVVAWGYVPVCDRSTTSDLEGWERLLRDLTQGPGESPDEVALPGCVRMKPGWRPLSRDL